MKLISSPCESCGKFKEWEPEQSAAYNHDAICHCISSKHITEIEKEMNEKSNWHHIYFHFKNNFILEIRHVTTSERDNYIDSFLEYRESAQRTLYIKHNNRSYSHIIKDLNHENYINVIDINEVIRIYSEPVTG